MASLRDVIRLRSYGTWAFFKRVWQQINETAFRLASALAYSWLFSVFPFYPSSEPRAVFADQPKQSAHNVISELSRPCSETPRTPSTTTSIRSCSSRDADGSSSAGGQRLGRQRRNVHDHVALDKCYDVKLPVLYLQRTLAIA